MNGESVDIESAEEDARLRSLIDRALPETNEEEEYP